MDSLLDGYHRRAEQQLARSPVLRGLAAAAGASVVGAATADAEFVQMAPFVSGPVVLSTNSQVSSSVRQLDLDGDGPNDIEFFVRRVSFLSDLLQDVKAGGDGTYSGAIQMGANNIVSGNAILGLTSPADVYRLNSGANIPGTNPIVNALGELAIHFINNTYFQSAGQWSAYDNAFMGVRWQAGGLGDVYGWIQVATVAPGPGNPRPVLNGPLGNGGNNQLILFNGFYNDTGRGITVPEPSAGLLAALGALALGARALRRRNQA